MLHILKGYTQPQYLMNKIARRGFLNFWTSGNVIIDIVLQGLTQSNQTGNSLEAIHPKVDSFYLTDFTRNMKKRTDFDLPSLGRKVRDYFEADWLIKSVDFLLGIVWLGKIPKERLEISKKNLEKIISWGSSNTNHIHYSRSKWDFENRHGTRKLWSNIWLGILSHGWG